MNPASGSSTDARAGAHSTFWLCLWLAGALAVTKAVHLGLPSEWSPSDLIDYGCNLAIVAHADALYALGVGCVGQLLLGLIARRPKIRRAIRAMLVATCVVSVLYAIASVRVFEYLRTPLTYPLIYLAGDMKNMRSSLGHSSRYRW